MFPVTGPSKYTISGKQFNSGPHWEQLSSLTMLDWNSIIKVTIYLQIIDPNALKRKQPVEAPQVTFKRMILPDSIRCVSGFH